jgi:predicted AAA+ superfamily ATPase
MITEFHSDPIPSGIHRDFVIPLLSKSVRKAYVYMGMRRCGKAYALYQRMHELMSSGLDQTKMLYINFEDDRLSNITVSNFQTLLDAYWSMYPEYAERDDTVFFFEALSAKKAARLYKQSSQYLERGGFSETLDTTPALHRELLHCYMDSVIYCRSKKEIDFLTLAPTGEMKLFQVCVSLSDQKTKMRETSVLCEAKQELKLKTGTIITLVEEGEIAKGQFNILIKPISKFWLQKMDDIG